MNVPVQVNALEINKQEILSLWCNGRNVIIDALVNPYFYAYKKFEIPNAISITKEKKIALSNYQERTFYKYSFRTRKELVQARNKIESLYGEGHTFEDNIPFILRNRIDYPDAYTKFPHENDLRFHFIDIEQYCPPTKLFPTYEDKISSLSYSNNFGKIQSIYLKNNQSVDSSLLQTYKRVYPKPDILVVYNKMYDIPVISIINLDNLMSYLRDRDELVLNLRAIESYRAQYGIV